jgi:hypothetical protein
LSVAALANRADFVGVPFVPYCCFCDIVHDQVESEIPDYEYYHLVGIKLSPEAVHRHDQPATSAPMTSCTRLK